MFYIVSYHTFLSALLYLPTILIGFMCVYDSTKLLTCQALFRKNLNFHKKVEDNIFIPS